MNDHLKKKAFKPVTGDGQLTRVNLVREARAFLQNLVDAGYAEEEILVTVKQMMSWLTEETPNKLTETELPSVTREFVERLLVSGISENKIMDTLNQVAILLIRSRRKNYEH